MNATRAFGILALGVAIGVGIGLAIPGLVGPPRDASRASSGRNTGLPVAPRLELEGEIARERSSRMKAEAERDKLEKDLAAARARLGNASESKGPPGPGALAPVASQAAALAKAPLTHPADILARVREIEGEAEDALKTRDMKKLLALIKEAASLGKDGWPVAIKLGSALMKSWEGQDTPFENQDYTETNVVLCSKEIAPLYEHAITSAETDPDFRRLAASYFRLTGAA
ncbi:hypothetical protein HY251_21170, partial [bacterium]|nr:hypothetical protein [bacterium]